MEIPFLEDVLLFRDPFSLKYATIFQEIPSNRFDTLVQLLSKPNTLKKLKSDFNYQCTFRISIDTKDRFIIQGCDEYRLYFTGIFNAIAKNKSDSILFIALPKLYK
jgi:hypothetical protein